MNYEDKQGWIEAVMADKNLSPAIARYAFGIYKHMYGNKDESFPGATALSAATGLNDGHFYKYNKALVEAGYLQVTSTRGRQNHYKLLLPTATGGRYLPPQEVDPPRVEVTPTSTGGTNTTSKTTTKTSTKDHKKAGAAAASPASAVSTDIKEGPVRKDKGFTTPLMTVEVDDSQSDDHSSNDLEADNAPTASGGRSGVIGTQKDIDNWLRERREEMAGSR